MLIKYNTLDIKDLFGYNLFLLKLKIENWKYCNKIIFKLLWVCDQLIRSLNWNMFRLMYNKIEFDIACLNNLFQNYVL